MQEDGDIRVTLIIANNFKLLCYRNLVVILYVSISYVHGTTMYDFHLNTVVVLLGILENYRNYSINIIT